MKKLLNWQLGLIRFITETRANKAFPILVTHVTRLVFDSLGNIKETHKKYSATVREVGRQYDVPVMDLEERSRGLVQTLGPVYSKMLYMRLDTLENPHYSIGRKDNTHFYDYGARRMAELVLAEIRKQKLALAERITTKAAP